jgi:hypothetical protein
MTMNQTTEPYRTICVLLDDHHDVMVEMKKVLEKDYPSLKFEIVKTKVGANLRVIGATEERGMYLSFFCSGYAKGRVRGFRKGLKCGSRKPKGAEI